MTADPLLSKEWVGCLFCKSGNFKSLYPSLPAVVKCECGFVYTNPRLKRDVIRDFYSRGYFESNASQRMGYDNYVSDKDLVEKTFKRRLSTLEKKWVKRKGRVLDVGCATGFFLSIAQEMGWEVSGVEISDYCCEYALREFGLKLHQVFFKDARDLGVDYDLITMWDYIEHSFNPDQDIERAYQLLRPSGILAIATPDITSLPARVFRHHWIGFKEHEHLHYFSRRNLTELLQKKGFQVRSASYIGKYISPKFFSKRLSEYSKFLGTLSKKFATLPLLDKAVFYCNPLDIIYLIAEKR